MGVLSLYDPGVPCEDGRGRASFTRATARPKSTAGVGVGGGVPEPGPELIRTRHGSKASRVSLHTASQQRAVLSRQVP